MKITVITPTYNRGEKLNKLYKSLIEQTNKDFIWLIIDDGSTDNTKKKVDEFIKEDEIQIEYYKKQNGGKHTALNFGISKIQTDLVFIVDSDDWLEENAIDKIYKYHNKYKENDEICGYSFLRRYSDGIINGKVLEQNEIIDDYINVRINGEDTNSDKAEVWKTKCLKKYPFPEFEGEKFLGEDVVWIQLALKYKMVFFNEPIYISEYLEDGLTKNRRENNIKSPNGCWYRSKIILDISKTKKIDKKYLIKNVLQYQIYGKFSNKILKDIYEDCERKELFILLFPIAIAIYINWKNKINKYNTYEG